MLLEFVVRDMIRITGNRVARIRSQLIEAGRHNRIDGDVFPDAVGLLGIEFTAVEGKQPQIRGRLAQFPASYFEISL